MEPKRWHLPWLGCALLLSGLCARGQDATMTAVLERLQRLEQENAKLRDEVRELRNRLDGTASTGNPGPPLEERVAVQEQRLEDQQQTKVESAQRVPVKLRGMLIFDALMSGRNGAPVDSPTIATGARGPVPIRGTFRQTSIGLDVESPYKVAGATARGEVLMDFYADYDDYSAPRIRTAFLDLQWPDTGLRFGIQKPIVAPRNPTSLANQIYPALWGSGNLWLWLPQVRLEQKLMSRGATDIQLQAGLLQTNDARTVPFNSPLTLQPRPGWEGRLAFARRVGEDKAFEFAPGFHYSRTLALGTSVPSQLITGDWRVAPLRQFEWTGAFFAGKNAGPIGGLRQGIVALGPGNVRAVGTVGGWTQAMYRPWERIRFHAMAGTQDDRNRDLAPGCLTRNLSWIVNGIYQLGPNILVGLEMQQIRSDFLGAPTRVLNRYDLSVAYLF